MVFEKNRVLTGTPGGLKFLSAEGKRFKKREDETGCETHIDFLALKFTTVRWIGFQICIPAAVVKIVCACCFVLLRQH